MKLPFLDPLRRALGMYDSNGLRHSLKHLNSPLTLAELATMSDKQTAEYADAYCVKNSSNEKFIADQLRNLNPSNTQQLRKFNATAVGNMAYIALYGPHAYRGKCRAALYNWRLYAKNLVGKTVKR